jgi:pimeloyl-ACP methyl ester carboxylesterase
MTSTTERAVRVWDGELEVRVRVAGGGRPLVYLHPAAGLLWDGFLDRLAERWTVLAPEHPGTSPGDPQAIQRVRDLWELVLVYEEVVSALCPTPPLAVGQSYGGMLAAELAATFPRLFSKLVLLDPVGLWREDAPVADWVATPPEELPSLLFHDPAAAAALPPLPADPDAAAKAAAAAVWAVGCTAKFVWPIPEKGLARRLHRVAVPTLVVWGREDRLVPAVYADEFGRRIAGARVHLVEGAGHVPQAERLEETFAVVSEFTEG